MVTKWSGREDSNLRPPGPKPGALPDCATPRLNVSNKLSCLLKLIECNLPIRCSIGTDISAYRGECVSIGAPIVTDLF